MLGAFVVDLFGDRVEFVHEHGQVGLVKRQRRAQSGTNAGLKQGQTVHKLQIATFWDIYLFHARPYMYFICIKIK